MREPHLSAYAHNHPRASALSAEFFQVVKDKFADKGKDFAFQFLFDFGHALGKSDAVNLQKKSSCPTGIIVVIAVVILHSGHGSCLARTPRPNTFFLSLVGVDTMLAGPIYFSYTGWAFIEILQARYVKFEISSQCPSL